MRVRLLMAFTSHISKLSELVLARVKFARLWLEWGSISIFKFPSEHTPLSTTIICILICCIEFCRICHQRQIFNNNKRRLLFFFKSWLVLTDFFNPSVVKFNPFATKFNFSIKVLKVFSFCTTMSIFSSHFGLFYQKSWFWGVNTPIP